MNRVRAACVHALAVCLAGLLASSADGIGLSPTEVQYYVSNGGITESLLRSHVITAHADERGKPFWTSLSLGWDESSAFPHDLPVAFELLSPGSGAESTWLGWQAGMDAQSVPAFVTFLPGFQYGDVHSNYSGNFLQTTHTGFYDEQHHQIGSFTMSVFTGIELRLDGLPNLAFLSPPAQTSVGEPTAFRVLPSDAAWGTNQYTRVRFDFESDGVYDTDWQYWDGVSPITGTATYTTPGTFDVSAQIEVDPQYAEPNQFWTSTSRIMVVPEPAAGLGTLLVLVVCANRRFRMVRWMDPKCRAAGGCRVPVANTDRPTDG